MAKILITESVHPIGPELLTAAGHTVVYADRDMDIIRREIVDADAVLVRIIELPGSLLATAKNLKIVSKHGVGYDNIDLDYCKSHGVAVTITPNTNSLSVAEHAFTLMLTLAKNIIPVSNEYREIGFAAKNHAPGIEMTGKTLGLIGMGRIGKHVLHMCKDGLDMHVIVYDPYISEVPEGVERVDDLSELLRRADPACIDGQVTFDHVKFGYTPEKTVIHNFSCNVKPGQKVAIVGPTGAGKTTMVNLLMRFFEVNSGRITIDGVRYELHEGESIVMPARHPHAVFGQEQFKMLLVVVF